MIFCRTLYTRQARLKDVDSGGQVSDEMLPLNKMCTP